MVKSGYRYVNEQYMKHDGTYGSNNWHRLVEFRKQHAIERIEKPSNLARARALGYKAKPGYVMVRARVKKGSRAKQRPRKGRKPHALGVTKYTAKKSLQWIAEERAQRQFPNLEVLNSYFVLHDGKHKWYEIIFVDPHHPVIIADSRINWIGVGAHKKRVHRGLTSAGKHSRGLHKKGVGSEKTRPSLGAHGNRGK